MTTLHVILSAFLIGVVLPCVRTFGRRACAADRRLTAALVAVALLGAACGDDDDNASEATPTASSTSEAAPPAPAAAATSDAPPPTEPGDPVAAAQARVVAAEADVIAKQQAVVEARAQFCRDTVGYIEALDRYGKVFTDEAATVGDVETRGADLVQPRDTVVAAAAGVEAANEALAAAEQELVDAQAALAEAIATASSVPTSTTTPATTTTTTIVPRATIERVEQAEADLSATAEGITAATPLAEATAEYNSAALALQMAWLKLLVDADCLTDEQHAQGLEAVIAYTTTLQTELQQLGYYEGEIDGIYGPLTVEAVKRLQADSALRETGFVDQATGRALDEQLAQLQQERAAAEMTRTASVQTVLTLTGFWTGPIDGEWTDELTAALREFQTALGVEPTGVVDAATLAAFQLALAELERLATATTTTTPSTTTTAPPSTPPTVPSTSPSVTLERAPDPPTTPDGAPPTATG
jgi:peptidoglycan hydrolase-like protein with peptidoglycan-binding domain